MSDEPGEDAADRDVPTVAQALREARDILSDIDDLSINDMTPLWLLHVHNELTLALRKLVDAVSPERLTAFPEPRTEEVTGKQATSPSTREPSMTRPPDSPVQRLVKWHDLVTHAEQVAAVATDDPVTIDRGEDPDLLLCSNAYLASLREQNRLAATVLGCLDGRPLLALDRLSVAFPWALILSDEHRARFAADVEDAVAANSANRDLTPLLITVRAWASTADALAAGIEPPAVDLHWLDEPSIGGNDDQAWSGPP